ERMVLDERNVGKRRECLQALCFVLHCALDQCHWGAVGRAVGQIRHERFGRWTLCHGLSDSEVERRGDTPGITDATRCDVNQARSLLCIVTEPHLRALAVCRCMVQGEWQIAQSL